MADTRDKSAPQGYNIGITTFLAMSLRILGPVFSIREAKAFLREAGKNIELFVPFYQWFGKKGELDNLAIRQYRFLQRAYGIEKLNVVHAGYSGRGAYSKRFFMNPANSALKKSTIEKIRGELNLIGLLRRELKIDNRIIYVLHPGVIEPGDPVRRAEKSCADIMRSVEEDARRNGVCVSIENLYSYHDERQLGSELGEIGDILGMLDPSDIEDGVFGWTYDLAHSLISYGGDYDIIRKEARPLFKYCVQLHINHPRIERHGGRLKSEWDEEDDHHLAPVLMPMRNQYWSLMAEAINKSRVPEWRTLTYEVNWGMPVIRKLAGGSPLRHVIIGYHALRHFLEDPAEMLDASAIERYIDERLAEKGRASQGS